tara:strand:- start:319 stop:438 length:120 start_codon:yes stop_codon:yes gene_type:complete
MLKMEVIIRIGDKNINPKKLIKKSNVFLNNYPPNIIIIF